MKHAILVLFFICVPSFAELRNPEHYKAQQVAEAQESAELCRQQIPRIGRQLSRIARMKRLEQIRRLNSDLAKSEFRRLICSSLFIRAIRLNCRPIRGIC